MLPKKIRIALRILIVLVLLFSFAVAGVIFEQFSHPCFVGTDMLLVRDL